MAVKTVIAKWTPKPSLNHPEVYSGDPRNLYVWSPRPGLWFVDNHGRFYPKTAGVEGSNMLLPEFRIEVPTRKMAEMIRKTVIKYYLGWEEA